MAALMNGNHKACPPLNDGEILTTRVVMYTTGVCPYCVMAERLLKAKGVESMEKIRIDLEPEQRALMMEKTGRRTVPQIYIGDTYIGGFDDLSALDRQGKLDGLLQGS